MKCQTCEKEWEVKILCPTCWEEMLAELKGTCMVCGGDIICKTIPVGDAEQILAVLCPNCRIIYKPM